MTNDEPTAHPQGDLFKIDRFHNDLQNFSKQIASCDKLVRMANISLNQIDARIAAAARVEANAASLIEATGQAAGRVAAEAATSAVADLVEQLAAATRQAEQVTRAIDRSRGKTGLWIACYVVCTLSMCLLTAWVTHKLSKPDPLTLTPAQVRAVELGERHEQLLQKASDKEKKVIADILARRAKSR